MPIPYGYLIMPRTEPTVIETQISIVSISPEQENVEYGDSVTITVLATAGSALLNGEFDIINRDNSAVLGTGTVVSGSGTVVIPSLAGFLNLQAVFKGNSSYLPSFSEWQPYSIPNPNTYIEFIEPASGCFVYEDPLQITVRVLSELPDTPTGYVKFWINENNENTEIGSQLLDLTGSATIIIPANTGESVKKYVYAQYLGNNPLLHSYQREKIEIHPKQNVSLSIFAPPDISWIYYGQYFPIDVNINVNFGLPPSDGYVKLTRAGIVLANNLIPVNGFVSATINKYDLYIGNNTIVATYYSQSGSCYFSSQPPYESIVVSRPEDPT